jgi:hypothetical protein
MPRSKKSTIQKNPLEQIYATDKVLTSDLGKGSQKINPRKLIPSIENTGPKTVNRESKNLTKIHKTNKDIRPQDISENISPQENKQDLLAYATIKKWSRLASACSIPPIPLLATAVASGLQIKMIQELCNIYHVPFHKELVKASISSIVGSLNGPILQLINFMTVTEDTKCSVPLEIIRFASHLLHISTS